MSGYKLSWRLQSNMKIKKESNKIKILDNYSLL